MVLGTDRNHLYVFGHGEKSRHWVLGEEWSAFLTLRGQHRGTVLKGWWKLGKSNITNHLELEVALGGEDNMVQCGIVLPWAGRVHLGVAVPRAWTHGWVYERREWALRVGYVGRWLELLIASDENMRDAGMVEYYQAKITHGKTIDPWSKAALWPGWHLTLNPQLRDRLLGRLDCTTAKGEPVVVSVPLPEGNYPGMATREVRTWQRKRWPFSRRTRVSWWVDMEVAPPVPGKGENSWDLGDDGIYGTGGSTLAQAVANVTKAALEHRERYGSRSWEPHGGWPAEAGRGSG